AVKSVIAGQDERLNWVQLMKFVNDALPRPDDKVEDINLLFPKAKELYWKPEAKKAHENLRKRQAAGGGLIGRAEKTGQIQFMDGIDSLVQFNIEGVDCRFADDLSTVWSQLALAKADLKSMRPRNAAPPSDKGWVVEVRGYTFHKSTDAFVIDALIENLARLGEAPTGAAAAGAAGRTRPAAPPPAGGGPAATPPGATPPATGPAAKPADAAAPPEGGKRGDAITGRISNVVMFRALPAPQFDPNTFQLI